MRKSKMFVSTNLLEKISDSDSLSYEEKMSFLRYSSYLKEADKKELIKVL